MKIIFMATPDFAIPTLQTLFDNHQIVAVYTQQPRPAKRGMELQKTPIHIKAEELKIPVFTPSNFKDEQTVKQFKDLDADIAVVYAYGLILPSSILQSPKYGCINIHPSILPKYRGPNPIRSSIINNDEETGVTIMQMDAGMDTGDMLAIEKVSITDETTYDSLCEELSNLGAYLVNEVINHIDQITPTPQDNEDATYTQKISKEDLKINWNEDAFAIDRKVRAYYPDLNMYFMYNGKRYKVISSTPSYKDSIKENGTTLNDSLLISCNDSTALQINEIQAEGKSPLKTAEFLKGNKFPADIVLE